MAVSNPLDIAKQALRFTYDYGCDQCGGKVGLRPAILEDGSFIQLCGRCYDALPEAEKSKG